MVLQSVASQPIAHLGALAHSAARHRNTVTVDSSEFRTPSAAMLRSTATRRSAVVPASPLCQAATAPSVTAARTPVHLARGFSGPTVAASPRSPRLLEPGRLSNGYPTVSVVTALPVAPSPSLQPRSPVIRSSIMSPSLVCQSPVEPMAGRRNSGTLPLDQELLDDGTLPEATSKASTGGSSRASTGGAASGAPSAALFAAVQLAAATSTLPASSPASSTPQVPVQPELGPASSILQAESASERPLEYSPAVQHLDEPRRRWASLTEEEMPWGGLLHPTKISASPRTSLLQSPSVVLRSPGLTRTVPSVSSVPTTASTVRPSAQAYSMRPAPARRRWASISDDDASPMLWPLRSPGYRCVRSHSSTPLLGAGTHPGTAGAPALAPVAEAFMLPQAHDNEIVHSRQHTGQRPNVLRTSVVTLTTPATAAAPSQVPACHSGARGSNCIDRPSQPLNGWTVVWIGEQAFRAPAALKDQIEAIGFMIKIYRSHDKCCRALDKKKDISPTNVFLIAEADSHPMLSYLCQRNSQDLRIVVHGAPQQPAGAQALSSRLPCPEDSTVTVACSWDEVLSALRTLSSEVSMSMPTRPTASQQQSPTNSLHVEVDAAPAVTSPSSNGQAPGDLPWTVIWISDQAFKPAAVPMRAQLEVLGCQVKGYKTHKNAARALDKKRALVRTVVLVSGADAAPFLAYLGSRPELSGTQIVAETSSSSVPIRKTPTCQVVEGFEAAVAAVRRVATDPNFT